jgi:hypothetical protein
MAGAFLALASVAPPTAPAANREVPVIDPDVRAAVVQGPTRVLVELRLPAVSASDTDARAPRKPAIGAARQAVLARLTGTPYRVVRQYATVPLLALEIGPEALRALEGMADVVSRVRVEHVRPPATPR